jgi:molecular chaperone GrpE
MTTKNERASGPPERGAKAPTESAGAEVPPTDTRPEPTLDDLLASGNVPPLVARALKAERERARKAEDRMLRALAEADNQRKRLARDCEERTRHANESLLREMLPVLDGLELALAHARDGADAKELQKGVELTLSLFRQVLRNVGVEPIGAERGMSFDPSVHEAIAQDHDVDLPERAIAKVAQSGFRYRERVLRPARVAVSSGKGRAGPG